ncbi:ribbon-helix-helix domain-containing protein, partial [Bacillus sp. D-CC]
SKSTEKKRRTFSINTEILARLDLISESKGIQKSKLVEEALQQFLQQYDFNNTSHFDN